MSSAEEAREDCRCRTLRGDRRPAAVCSTYNIHCKTIKSNEVEIGCVFSLVLANRFKTKKCFWILLSGHIFLFNCVRGHGGRGLGSRPAAARARPRNRFSVVQSPVCRVLHCRAALLTTVYSSTVLSHPLCYQGKHRLQVPSLFAILHRTHHSHSALWWLT